MDFLQFLPGHPTKPADGKAKLTYDHNTKDSAATYVPGTAQVVAGRVTVSSMDKKVRFDKGYMQATLNVFPLASFVPNPNNPYTPGGTQFIADAFRVDFKLREGR